MSQQKEKQYYQIIKEKFEELFKSKGIDVYLEITSDKFSEHLKEKIPDHLSIIFSFIDQKGARPDITGYFQKNTLRQFIVIEIKKDKIKIDHIYQLKKYAELFEAHSAFLVSLEQIPAEIKN